MCFSFLAFLFFIEKYALHVLINTSSYYKAKISNDEVFVSSPWFFFSNTDTI